MGQLCETKNRHDIHISSISSYTPQSRRPSSSVQSYASDLQAVMEVASQTKIEQIDLDKVEYMINCTQIE